jgi:hypothetical protein
MVAWNTKPPKISFNTCDRPAAHMEALASASKPTYGNYLGEAPSTPHAHRQMVERRFSSLHLKTGGAILVQRRKEEADLSVFLSYPRHRSSTNIFRRPPAAQPS